MNNIKVDILVEHLTAVIRTLKPYEKIEIKLQDNRPGEISIVVTSNHKEVFEISK